MYKQCKTVYNSDVKKHIWEHKSSKKKKKKSQSRLTKVHQLDVNEPPEYGFNAKIMNFNFIIRM